MKLKKTILVIVTAAMLVVAYPSSIFAATHDNVDSDAALRAALENDTDENITINLSGDITLMDDLKLAPGKVITIDGKAYVITMLYEEDKPTHTITNQDNEDQNDESERPEIIITVKEFVNLNVNGSVDLTLNGNASGGMETDDGTFNDADPSKYIDGIDAVSARGNSKVTINGDVTGGDAKGTYGWAGSGIAATGNSSVAVNGNVIGGNVIANPNTVNHENNVSQGGSGIWLQENAKVVVYGNVTGGNTNGQGGQGGNGAEIEGTYPDDGDTGTSLTVTGTLGHGTATGSNNSTNGAALVFKYYGNDGPEPPVPWNLELNQNALLDFSLSDQIITKVKVFALAKNPEGQYYRALVEGEIDEELTAAMTNDITYILKTKETVGGTISLSKSEAKAGEKIVVNYKANDGYKLKSIMLNDQLIEMSNNEYSFTVPEGGNVNVSAAFEKTTDKNIVKTGDDYQLPLFIMLLLLSVSSMVAIKVRKG